MTVPEKYLRWSDFRRYEKLVITGIRQQRVRLSDYSSWILQTCLWNCF